MTPARPPVRLRVLLVEDSEWDAKMAIEALQSMKRQVTVDHARDGRAAMERLRRPTSSRDHLPNLILLDLNLPVKDGREVLAEIKSDPRLKRIAVLVLTTSTAPADIAMAYDLHANSYVNKPFNPEDYPRLMEDLGAFWSDWNIQLEGT